MSVWKQNDCLCVWVTCSKKSRQCLKLRVHPSSGVSFLTAGFNTNAPSTRMHHFFKSNISNMRLCTREMHVFSTLISNTARVSKNVYWESFI